MGPNVNPVQVFVSLYSVNAVWIKCHTLLEFETKMTWRDGLRRIWQVSVCSKRMHGFEGISRWWRGSRQFHIYRFIFMRQIPLTNMCVCNCVCLLLHSKFVTCWCWYRQSVPDVDSLDFGAVPWSSYQICHYSFVNMCRAAISVKLTIKVSYPLLPSLWKRLVNYYCLAVYQYNRVCTLFLLTCHLDYVHLSVFLYLVCVCRSVCLSLSVRKVYCGYMAGWI